MGNKGITDCSKSFIKTKKTIFWLFTTRIINNELKEEKLLFRFSQ